MNLLDEAAAQNYGISRPAGLRVPSLRRLPFPPSRFG